MFENPKKRTPFIISVFVALSFVLLILGKPFTLPYPGYVEYNNPVAFCQNEEASLVVDSGGSRFLFLDGDGKLSRIIKLDDSALIDNTLCAVCDEEYFYVFGFKYVKDSNVIYANRIVRYDLNGRNPYIITEQLKKNNEVMYEAAVLSISDGNLYLLKSGANISAYTLTRIDVETKETEELQTFEFPMVYMEAFAPKENAVYINDYYGHLYRYDIETDETVNLYPGYPVVNFLPYGEDDLIWFDFLDYNIYKNDELILANADANFGLYPCKDGFAFSHMMDDGFSIFNLNDGTETAVTAAEYSLKYMLFSLICTLSIAYLVTLCILAVVYAMRNMARAENYTKLKQVGTRLLLFFLTVLISVLYNFSIVKIEKENIEEYVSSYSRHLAYSVQPDELSDATYTVEKGDDSEAFEKYLAAYASMDDKYSYFGIREDGSSLYDDLIIMKKDGDKLIFVYDSLFLAQPGSAVPYEYYEPFMNSGEVFLYNKVGYNTYYAISPVTDENGETAGAILFGRNYVLSNKEIARQCLDLAVLLITIFAAIYVIGVEIIEFIKGLKRRKDMLAAGKGHSEAQLVRTVSFLFYVINFADSIVFVFVTRELLSRSGLAETSFMLALPALTMGVGAALSFANYYVAARRMNIRRVCVLACISIFLSRLGIYFSVVSGNYVLFCIFKFTDDLFASYIVGILHNATMKTESEEERYYVSRQFSLGRISGIVMGALLSGYLISDISNAHILYAISAALVIPMGLLLFKILPAKTIYVTNIGGGVFQDIKLIGKFLKSRTMLAFFVLTMMPMYLLMGYQGYLFPIYSDAADIPAIYITTAFVLSRFFLLIVSDSVNRLFERMNQWKSALYMFGLIGFAFLGFAINSSIIWAVIMLVISGAAETFIMPIGDVLWSRQAKAQNMPLTSVSPVIAFINEVLCAFKETALSVFLLFGNNNACVALGVFCITAALIFRVITRKQAMAVAGK